MIVTFPRALEPLDDLVQGALVNFDRGCRARQRCINEFLAGVKRHPDLAFIAEEVGIEARIGRVFDFWLYKPNGRERFGSFLRGFPIPN